MVPHHIRRGRVRHKPGLLFCGSSWYNIGRFGEMEAEEDGILLKWTNEGEMTPNTVYIFTWGIIGRVHWFWFPDVYALSTHLYRVVRDNVTPQATVPEGYPRYSQHQDITLFQVRAPVYELDRVIYVEEVLEKADRVMRAYTSQSFGLIKEAQYFMPPSGPLAGKTLPLPGAFVASMQSDDVVTDPTGVPGPKSQFEKLWDSFGFEEVFTPVKTVVKWGLAGLAGYAIYKVYRGLEAIPLPAKKEG